MNEQDRDRLRQSVLNGADDLTIQLEWNKESLTEHLKIEQRLKARFRLVDFSGDTEGMIVVEKDINEVRALIGFIQDEIARIEQALKG